MMKIRFSMLLPTQIHREFDPIFQLMMTTLGSKSYNEPWSTNKLERRLVKGTRFGIVQTARNDLNEIIGISLGFPLVHAMDEGMPPNCTDGFEHITFYGAGLFVKRSWQKHGIGSKLIKNRLLFFKQRGFTKFVSVTNTVGSHISLYQKMGYRFDPHPVALQNYSNAKFIIRGNIDQLLERVHHAELAQKEKGLVVASGIDFPTTLITPNTESISPSIAIDGRDGVSGRPSLRPSGGDARHPG